MKRNQQRQPKNKNKIKKQQKSKDQRAVEESAMLQKSREMVSESKNGHYKLARRCHCQPFKKQSQLIYTTHSTVLKRTRDGK